MLLRQVPHTSVTEMFHLCVPQVFKLFSRNKNKESFEICNEGRSQSWAESALLRNRTTLSHTLPISVTNITKVVSVRNKYNHQKSVDYFALPLSQIRSSLSFPHKNVSLLTESPGE